MARKRCDYFRFLALRFVFFAVFFAAALAFLRFAIVPSELEMALSKSAFANRHALQFDYYRMHKTATPLNETCTRTRAHALRPLSMRDDATIDIAHKKCGIARANFFAA